MTQPTLYLAVRGEGRIEQAKRAGAPFMVEHVTLPPGEGYDFSWEGASAYIGLHDMILADGEMDGDFAITRRRDLRKCLTFFPRGVRASGWGQATERANSYTALYFDQPWLLQQLEAPLHAGELRPSIYFRDRRLLQTMQRLSEAVRSEEGEPKLLIESLALVAGIDLVRAMALGNRAPAALSSHQFQRAKDYIAAHLYEDISLGAIAEAAGLSVYHFARAFKASAGMTPYRYVLEARIAKARAMLKTSNVSLEELSQTMGFANASHLSRTFKRIVGVSPRLYRSQARD